MNLTYDLVIYFSFHTFTADHVHGVDGIGCDFMEEETEQHTG